VRNSEEISEYGNAYAAVRIIYDHSPGRSWQRLNGALRSTLQAAIVAHLSFKEGDFQAAYTNMCGHYWFGNSEGSEPGEMLYRLAVEVGHIPACISYEKFAGRPAALWAWSVKTPERLCIGSRFKWQGKEVTVTNMKADHLIACSYRQNLDWKNPRVGDFDHFSGGSREIKVLKKSGKGLIVHFGPVVEYHREDRKPEKIFKITYEDLSARRKEYDKARKAALALIEESKTPEQLKDIRGALDKLAIKGEYRPFDSEEIKAAMRATEEKIKSGNGERK
jgi:hypothetical protein